MWNKTVTLFIDDTSIRLLVTSGSKIKKWIDLPLEPGLVKGAAVVEEEKMAEKIKQLLKSHKISAKRIVLGYSGLHSLTRPIVLPPLPKAMLEEAVIREARRVLPIPPEQLYISWLPIAGPKGEVQLFLSATPRKTTDALVKTVQAAGLVPYQMVPKTLALTRAVKERTAIIVDVQPTEFDIVVMSEGIPQPIRTIPFPVEAQSWEDKMPKVISELERTIAFFNTNNPERPLGSRVPLYVSGELSNQPETQQALSKALGLTVLVLAPPIKVPEQLNLSRHMVSIALAFKALSPQALCGSQVADFNVLPAPYQVKPISLTRVAVTPGAAVFLGIVVPLVMLMQSASASIDSMQSQINNTNQITNQRNAQKQELKKTIAEMEKKVAASQASLNTFAKAVASLARQQDMVNTDFRLAISTLPNDLVLSGVDYASNKVIITGKAKSEADVLAYAKKLNSSGKYLETTVASMKLDTKKAPEAESSEVESSEVESPEQESTEPVSLTDTVIDFAVVLKVRE